MIHLRCPREEILPVFIHRMYPREISSGRRLWFLIFFVCVFSANVDLARTNVICSFDICTFNPAMCANGGRCKMNEQCLPECICPPKYSGIRCEILDMENSTCQEACGPKTCSGHGHCIQDVETCNISCDCLDGYHGRFCNASTSNGTDAEECFPLICDHGRCNRADPNTVSCECEDKWTGDLCDMPCTRNCSQGRCVNYLGVENCSCTDDFTPESNCTVRIQAIRAPRVTIETGLPLRFHVFVVLFPLLLVFLFSLLVYVMWRKRMIFVMKIVYYLQKYEDSDGKIYDAFISFRSSKSDEYWVLSTLFPMLENEMGFKICVHYRDFLVGETISNNIIDAIEKSRRTILVISPDYVNGEWTRMEYQVAQQEMLNLRHKIIPIMFRDVGDLKSIDKNLKLILNSITYIKWPTKERKKDVEKFWEQLRLTMPKKHEVKSTLKGGDVINEYTADTKL